MNDQSLSRKTVHPFINYTKDGWRGSVAAEAVLFSWLCVPICRWVSSSLPASPWRWDGDHPAGLRIRMCGPGSVETWAGLVVGAGSFFFEGFWYGVFFWRIYVASRDTTSISSTSLLVFGSKNICLSTSTSAVLTLTLCCSWSVNIVAAISQGNWVS